MVVAGGKSILSEISTNLPSRKDVASQKVMDNQRWGIATSWPGSMGFMSDMDSIISALNQTSHESVNPLCFRSILHFGMSCKVLGQ